MQLEYAEKEAVGKRGATIKFVIPAIQSHAAHREEIIRLRVLADGNLMTVSKDGQMFCWKAKDLSIDKSMRLGITEDRSKCWVTDCSIVSSMNRIFAFTGDREILIYDSVSLELYCRITNFESVPLRFDLFICKNIQFYLKEFTVTQCLSTAKSSLFFATG
jgi:WD40 repeat protein